MIIFSILIIQAWMLSVLYRLEGHRKFYYNMFLGIKGQIFDWKSNLFLRVAELERKSKHWHQAKYDKVAIDSKIATKTADRAFNLASSANLGVVALQKALATPKLITREASKLNQLAKNSVDELFTTQGQYDWLKPLLSDQDLELLEEIEQKKLKDSMKSPPQ